MDSLSIVGLAFAFVALVWVALRHHREMASNPRADIANINERFAALEAHSKERMLKLDAAVIEGLRQIDSLKAAIGLKQLGR